MPTLPGRAAQGAQLGRNRLPGGAAAPRPPAEHRPDALIVYPDGAVHGVIQAILQLGIAVPGELRTFFHRNVELGYFCVLPADYMDVKIETAADILIADLFNNGERN